MGINSNWLKVWPLYETPSRNVLETLDSPEVKEEATVDDGEWTVVLHVRST